MGLFDKVKNLFTEEVDEDIQPVRKETRHVEVSSPKVSIEKEEISSRPIRPITVEEPKEEIKETREEKFVFFSDDDFKDLEKPKKEEIKKPEKQVEKPLAYKGVLPQTKVEPKKEFKPSPIISPVYGVLDHNYKKEEIKTKKTTTKIYRSPAMSLDDVRNKAYGTLEDEIKDDLLGKAFIEQKEEPIESDINIFEELEKYNSDEETEEITKPIDDTEESVSRSTSDVDEIFGKLDNKKEEILDELDNKKVEILDELDTKKVSSDLLSTDILKDEEDNKNENVSSDVDLAKNMLDDDLDNDTEALAKELEVQKKKLKEINSIMDENEKVTKTTKGKKKKKEESPDDDLEDSELFNLIDSMYDKKDDE